MMVAKLILLHFGAFVPGSGGEPPKAGSEFGCPGFGCTQKCLGPADQNWAQAVGSGILNVVLKGNKMNYNCRAVAGGERGGRPERKFERGGKIKFSSGGTYVLFCLNV